MCELLVPKLEKKGKDGTGDFSPERERKSGKGGVRRETMQAGEPQTECGAEAFLSNEKSGSKQP